MSAAIYIDADGNTLADRSICGAARAKTERWATMAMIFMSRFRLLPNKLNWIELAIQSVFENKKKQGDTKMQKFKGIKSD